MLWILFSFVLASDIFINASTDNTNCFEEIGCSINSLMNYLEDTNGDILHILGNISNASDTSRLISWLSMKSFSQLTIIGSPSTINCFFSKADRIRQLKLNESIITFDKITFLDNNSPFLSTAQTFLSIKNSVFVNTKISENEFMRIEDSSCSFSNVTFQNPMNANFFCLFIKSKVQFENITVNSYHITLSNSILFAFRKKCELSLQAIDLTFSKHKNYLIQIEDSFASLSYIYFKHANSIFLNAIWSEVRIYQFLVAYSNFTFGKIQNSFLNVSSFYLKNITNSQTVFDIQSSNFTFYQNQYACSKLNSIIRADNSPVTSIEDCSFVDIEGTGTFFTMTNSQIKIDQLQIVNVTLPQYGRIINNRNTRTFLMNSLMAAVQTPQSLGFLINIKDEFIVMTSTKFYKNEIAILNVVSANWSLENVTACMCRLQINDQDQSSMAMIVGTAFDLGSISNCTFDKCDIPEGIIHCIQAKLIDIITTRFIDCRGIKTGVISMVYSDISINQCIFKDNSALFHNCLISLQECSSIISNCVFSQNENSEGSTLKVFSPTKFSLSQVQASEYNFFAVFYDVKNPISIIDCVFAKPFSDSLLFHNSQKEIGLLHKVYFNSQQMDLPISDFESRLSMFNYLTFRVREAKLTKHINYATLHENYVFSPTRYYEYMMNMEPLSRKSPPFRPLPDLLNESVKDFRSEIEKCILDYDKLDQALFYTSQFTIMLVIMKYIIIPFIALLYNYVREKIAKKKMKAKVKIVQNADIKTKHVKKPIPTKKKR